jgi:hypothetical protein
MRVGAPDELSAVLLAERLGRDPPQSDESWYLDYKRPPTRGPAAELLAEVRCWLAALSGRRAGAVPFQARRLRVGDRWHCREHADQVRKQFTAALESARR